MNEMSDVFNWIITASKKDLEILGYRIGEKMDSGNPWDEIICPLICGVRSGTILECPFVIPDEHQN